MHHYLVLSWLFIFLVIIAPYVSYIVFKPIIPVPRLLICVFLDTAIFLFTYFYATDIILPYVVFKCCEIPLLHTLVIYWVLWFLIILKLLLSTNSIRSFMEYKFFATFWSCVIIASILLSGWAWDLIFPYWFGSKNGDIIPSASQDVINGGIDNYFGIRK